MKFIFVLVSILLSGCATKLEGTITPLYDPTFKIGGTVKLIPESDIQKDSLEFLMVKNIIESNLIKIGFTIADDNPNYIGIVRYGIDDGKTFTTTYPTISQVSGGYSSTTGTINSGSSSGTFTANTYTTPKYATTGSYTQSYTIYKRKLDFFLYENKNQGFSGRPSYHGKVMSSGSCGNITAVVSQLIDILFYKFPGNNGKTLTHKVIADRNC